MVAVPVVSMIHNVFQGLATRVRAVVSLKKALCVLLIMSVLLVHAGEVVVVPATWRIPGVAKTALNCLKETPTILKGTMGNVQSAQLLTKVNEAAQPIILAVLFLRKA